MGLDMYLEGHKYLMTDREHPKNNQTEDGFKIRERILELGYWRNHPNLHGYIVKTFADNVDEGQEIKLSYENLKQILKAVQEDALPHTEGEGFFFGKSKPCDKQPTIEILQKAIEWLKTETGKGKIARWVIYRAFW